MTFGTSRLHTTFCFLPFHCRTFICPFLHFLLWVPLLLHFTSHLDRDSSSKNSGGERDRPVPFFLFSRFHSEFCRWFTQAFCCSCTTPFSFFSLFSKHLFTQAEHAYILILGDSGDIWEQPFSLSWSMTFQTFHLCIYFSLC